MTGAGYFQMVVETCERALGNDHKDHGQMMSAINGAVVGLGHALAAAGEYDALTDLLALAVAAQGEYIRTACEQDPSVRGVLDEMFARMAGATSPDCNAAPDAIPMPGEMIEFPGEGRMTQAEIDALCAKD